VPGARRQQDFLGKLDSQLRLTGADIGRAHERQQPSRDLPCVTHLKTPHLAAVF
jgi:hypothetical protein